MSAIRIPTGDGQCQVEIDAMRSGLVSIREIGPRGSVRAGIFLSGKQARELARLLRFAAALTTDTSIARNPPR